MLNYVDAINKIANDLGKDSFQDNTLIYFLLSDYIGKSYNDKLLVKAYYDISKQIDIYNILLNNEVNECKNIFSKEYNKFKDIITPTLYSDAIRPIAKLFYPNDFVGKQEEKVQNTNAPIVILRNNIEVNVSKLNRKHVKNYQVNNHNSNTTLTPIKILSIISNKDIKIYSTNGQSYYIDGVYKTYFTSMKPSNKGEVAIKSNNDITVYLTDNLVKILKLEGHITNIYRIKKNILHFDELDINCKNYSSEVNCDSNKTYIHCNTWSFKLNGCHRSLTFDNICSSSWNDIKLDISNIYKQSIKIVQHIGKTEIHFKNYPRKSELVYFTLLNRIISKELNIGKTKVSLECEGILSKVTIN